MPPLRAAIILGFAPCAPLVSHRVWCHAQVWLVGAMLAPRARTVTAALRGMGWAAERRFTNSHRVLNRAMWSTRQAGRLLLGWRITWLMPAGATIVRGADDTMERRSGRTMRAKGGYRDAVRSSKQHILRCVGLQWVAMMRLVPVPWSRRVWAWPFLTALCWPQKQRGPRRHQTRVDGVRQMMKPVRRWLPERPLVLVADGGFAAVSLVLACVQNGVVMVSCLRWDAALYHPPGPQPRGTRGPNPLQGTRQRRVQAWAERAETPGQDVEVAWYGGQRKKLWGFAHTALWQSRGVPPVDIRYVLVCDPEGKLRMEAFVCTDLQATPAHLLAWVVRRWSVEGTVEEVRTHRGGATPRHWADRAIARTTPVLLALGSIVTLLALRLSEDRPIPVPATAGYHKAEPTCADCWALVRRPRWWARYVVHSAAEAECVQFPRETVDRLMHGVPFAA